MLHQQKIPLLTTGANGLVGSKFVEIFENQYEVQNLDLKHPTHPTDITKPNQVLQAFEESEAEAVIHLAAFTNVTAAWEQKGDKSGTAYQVNVDGTKNIVDACRNTGKFLIHISTAYVFDGENESLYTEDDQPNPIEWYGQTKWEAEQAVMQSEIGWSILRIDQPFRSDSFERPDVVRKIINALKKDRLPPQFTNQYFGPTYINDFSKVLDFFIRTKTQGLFHAASGEKWSPYEFAQLIKEAHQLDGEVKKGDLAEYLKTLNRPYQKNTAMSSEKLAKAIDFKLINIQEAIKTIEL